MMNHHQNYDNNFVCQAQRDVADIGYNGNKKKIHAAHELVTWLSKFTDMMIFFGRRATI